MLDLNYVRENIDAVRAALEKRGAPGDALDNFAQADAERRLGTLRKSYDQVCAERAQLEADKQRRDHWQQGKSIEQCLQERDGQLRELEKQLRERDAKLNTQAALERAMSFQQLTDSFDQQIADQETQVEALKAALKKLELKLQEASARRPTPTRPPSGDSTLPLM